MSGLGGSIVDRAILTTVRMVIRTTTTVQIWVWDRSSQPGRGCNAGGGRGARAARVTHLGESKAGPERSLELFRSAQKRLSAAGYVASITPFGYFNDLELKAPGHPLARIYKQW